MKRALSIAVLPLLLASQAYAQGAGGRGYAGVITECESSPLDNTLKGWYALDRVIPSMNAGAAIATVGSLDDSVKRIGDLIHRKLPELEASYDAFFSTPWQDNLPLYELKTHEIPPGLWTSIPRNCMTRFQVAAEGKQIRGTAIDLLRASPVNHSFVLHHEWLRQLGSALNPSEIQRMNHFFHSDSFEGPDDEALCRTIPERLHKCARPVAELRQARGGEGSNP